MEIREKLKRKKSEKKVIQFLEQMNDIKFIGFINAKELTEAREILDNFHKSDSEPNSTISNSMEASIIIKWVIESLRSLVLMENTQFIFTFGDIEEPVWVKVHTESVKEALLEFWNNSVSKEFVFIHQEKRMIWAIFSEEYSYEVHEGKW